MRCNHFKRVGSVWACASAIALLSGSAAFAELPGHPAIQTLEATHEEIQPDPNEMPQSLEFGYATAIRNGTAFIGMPGAFDTGRVAIFTQTASGWQRSGTLIPSGTVQFEDNFGHSLAFRDGYVIVNSDRATYVFRRSGGQWSQSQRIAAPGVAASFNESVHYESGVLVIGWPAGRKPGAAYIYEPDAQGKFALRTVVTAADGHDDDQFGFDVSVASGIVVVGAPDNFRGTGAAYVFRRNSSGNWTQRQKLLASETQAHDGFGSAVAIDKGLIIVGAPNVDVEGYPWGPPTSDQHIAGGAAYGFTTVAGSFVETFRLRPRADENFAYVDFGRDIAMFDKRIAVGALGIEMNTTRSGYVHTYTRDGSNLTARGLAKGFTESNSIEVANQWLLVGSPFDFQCHNIGTCIGQANLFDLNRFTQ